MPGSLNAMWGACILYGERWVPQKNRGWLHKDLFAPPSRRYEPGRGSHTGKPVKPRAAHILKIKFCLKVKTKKNSKYEMLTGGWPIFFGIFLASVSMFWRGYSLHILLRILAMGKIAASWTMWEEEEWRGCGDEGVAEQDRGVSWSSYSSKPKHRPSFFIEA